MKMTRKVLPSPGLRITRTSEPMVEPEPEQIDPAMLDEEIEESKEAQKVLDEQERLKQQAAKLPDLQKQKDRKIAQSQADVILAEAEKEVRQKVEQIKPQVLAWRKRHTELKREVDAHVKELDKITRETFDAYRELESAGQIHLAAHYPDWRPDPTKLIVTAPQSPALAIWQRLVGDGSELKTLPPGHSGKRYDFDFLVREAARAVCYSFEVIRKKSF